MINVPGLDTGLSEPGEPEGEGAGDSFLADQLTRGADYAHHITMYPLPNLQTFLRPWREFYKNHESCSTSAQNWGFPPSLY